MKIAFAASRPAGEFALVIPSSGSKRPAVGSLGDKSKVEAALKRQRFDGDSGSTAELFIDDGGSSRRLLVVGTGSETSPAQAAEKLGGTAAARLLTSGETEAVIDLTGLDFDADAAARVALAATLRSWRYDRYRTKLKEKQKPTLKTVTVVGGGDGAEQRWNKRWHPVLEGVELTRGLVTEPANVIYPESFVERCSGLPRARCASPGCSCCAGTVARKAFGRSLSSARASPSTPAGFRSSRPRAWKR
jgi:leucyl aminopeptidase